MEDFWSRLKNLTWVLSRHRYAFLWAAVPEDFRQTVAMALLERGFAGSFTAACSSLRGLAIQLGWHQRREGKTRQWVGELEYILTGGSRVGAPRGNQNAAAHKGRNRWSKPMVPQTDGKRGGLEL